MIEKSMQHIEYIKYFGFMFFLQKSKIHDNFSNIHENTISKKL